MCDIKKFDKIYKDIETLSQRDIMAQKEGSGATPKAKTEDEKNFYETIGNFFLQKRQRECIERNVF